MSRVQGKDSDLSSELPFSNLKERCEGCRNISACNVCGSSISGFEHIGVRAAAGQESGIWHYASPCRHRNQLRATSANVKYGGGPLWKNGYTWQSIYWGPYFTSSSASAWVASLEKAIGDIESDKTYSGGLSQYNVGIGKISPLINVKTAPGAKISDAIIKQTLSGWIASGTAPNLGGRAACKIFLPPGGTVSLTPVEVSGGAFCDYHMTADAPCGRCYTRS